jgi:hypothetical protein
MLARNVKKRVLIDVEFKARTWIFKMKENQKSLSGNDMQLAETTRQARVDAIKQAVKVGNYQVDDHALADSLISDLLWEQWERIRFYKT